MNTTKKWSLVAGLCGLLVATLLTACGGGMRNEPTPNKGGNSTDKTTEHTIEHIFIFDADKPVDFTWKGGAFAYKINLRFNGKEVEYSLASEISEENITHGHYVVAAKLQGDGQNISEEGTLKSLFQLHTQGDAYIDYLLNNMKNPVTYTIEERIDGETIKKESKTIVLDCDNSSNVVNIVSEVKF